MASYHWAIATDEDGTELYTFTMNPVDISGMFPERTYTSIPTLSGPTMLQFPDYDTRLRTMRFDLVPEENTTHRDFLLGTSESDSSSLLYLDRLDSDGQLTKYWLKIPEVYKHWRPRGNREKATIPIRVEEVRVVPGAGGMPRWRCEVFFRIIPKPQASEYFTVAESELDGLNFLIANQLNAVYSYDLNLTTFSDETTEANSTGDAWPDFTIAAGDFLYFGCTSRFYGIKFTMDTAETVTPDTEQGKTANSWELWDTSWSSLTVSDYTESFVKDNTVVWGEEAGWVAANLADTGISGPTTSSYYWVRVEVGTVTTAWTIETALRA